MVMVVMVVVMIVTAMVMMMIELLIEETLISISATLGVQIKSQSG